MLGNIITFVVICFITLIPVVLWGYLFSYFDDSPLNRKRFGVGILAGGISVAPVLYLQEIISQTHFSFLNIFSSVAGLVHFGDIFGASFSLVGIVFLLSSIPFFIFSSFENYSEKLKKFAKNFGIFTLYGIGIMVIFYLLGKIFDAFPFLDRSYDFGLKFGDIEFNSLKLVVFYYFIIALLEELSKFFCFQYSKIFSIVTIKQSILYAIFVALGFAFLENILYFKKLYDIHGFGKDLVAVYFSRNMFSVILHVLCSSVFAYYFSFVYLKFKEDFNLEFLKILFIGFALAILLHGFFDIFLTFGWTFFVVIYLIGSYFYLSYLFYKE